MGKAVAVLLLDDGELDDIQQFLVDAKVPYGRVRGGAIAPNTPPPTRLLITTPRRLSAVRIPARGTPAGDALIRIVVVQEDSTTLRAQLREVGFDYLVRRPVHPEALRLLVLHCLYTGEERRSEPRIPVGFEVSFRTGLLPRRAVLADLSTRGCRLLSKWAIEPGKRITLTIPQRAGVPEAVTVKGSVVRIALDETLGPEGPYSAAVAFEPLSPDVRHEIEWILEERARGPATLGRDLAAEGHADEAAEPRREDPAVIAPPETRAGDLQRQIDVEVDVRLDASTERGTEAQQPHSPREALPTASAPQRAAAAPPSPASADRRTAGRHVYRRRVPAFGERAMRVLVGRDLSTGGMRVERESGLEVGDRVHLAIYGAADEEPFLVWATVERDDGQEGMGLVFDELHPIVAEQLERLVGDLPSVESLAVGEAGSLGTVVGEILSR
jgi:hypothetical protein